MFSFFKRKSKDQKGNPVIISSEDHSKLNAFHQDQYEGTDEEEATHTIKGEEYDYNHNPVLHEIEGQQRSETQTETEVETEEE